jgi:hypothetical protein
MNEYLTEADYNDPSTAAITARNERVAREVLALLWRRNKKKAPTDAIEHIANTLGIAAAELTRELYKLMGKDTSDAIADLIIYHIERAREMTKAMEAKA